MATVNSARLAGLFELVPERLARTGFKLERVLSWSENQVYDKAIFKGSRKAFPSRLTAVQSTPLFPNGLNNFRTLSNAAELAGIGLYARDRCPLSCWHKQPTEC